jgi:Ala-tRNA(Pro) deacylase
MAVLPADTKIDWASLARALGTGELALASEGEVEKLFPDLEAGAVPPLGPLFELPVYVDTRLSERDRIAFNGGSHTSTIHMTFNQFRRLVEPRIGSFAVPEY